MGVPGRGCNGKVTPNRVPRCPPERPHLASPYRYTPRGMGSFVAPDALSHVSVAPLGKPRATTSPHPQTEPQFGGTAALWREVWNGGVLLNGRSVGFCAGREVRSKGGEKRTRGRAQS